MICSHCDRGNIYCGSRCSTEARQNSLKAAGQRYQNTHQGRRKHADRQRRYRRHRKKVTHQGSPALPDDGLLSPDLNVLTTSPTHTVTGDILCHFCGKKCIAFVRRGFIRNHLRYEAKISSSWARGP
jgi:hypothetical protein